MASPTPTPKLPVYADRKWKDVVRYWSEFIPPLGISDLALECSLEDLDAIQAALPKESVDARWEVVTVEAKIRISLLREAFAALCKARHLAFLTTELATEGRTTWSRYTAYQSGYLSACSLLALLGVTTLRKAETKKTYVADVWSEAIKADVWEASNLSELAIHPVKSIAQKEMWALFKLAVARCLIPKTATRKELLKFVSHVSFDEFARIRNSLQYDHSYWIYGDLMERAEREDVAVLFKEYLNEPDVCRSADSLDPTYSLTAFLGLYQVVFALWKDVATVCPGLDRDLRGLGGPELL